MSEIICIRGAGDIATGVIQKFVRSGYRVLALEMDQPTAIRCQAALSAAMVKGEMQVEDIRAKRVEGLGKAIEKCWEQGIVPIIADREGKSIPIIKPLAVIDAILAKRNLGTHHKMAPITIGLGPGFSAPEDVDIVIETMRGHNLGRIIRKGQAIPNTGIPGEIGGQSSLRVIHAPETGKVKHFTHIGKWVEQNQPVIQVGLTVIRSPFSGMVRGLIAEGTRVERGLKIADIDPRRLEPKACCQISDKARCIGGAALEAYLMLELCRRNS